MAAGWGLYLLGGSALRPLGRVRHSEALVGLGTLVGLIGLGLTVWAAIRLLRANAGERRAQATLKASPPLEGVWPPPPDVPVTK